MDTEVTFRLDQAAVERLLTGREGPVARQLAAAGARIERRAKHLCPVDTGRLRSSITHATFSENGALVEHVGTDVEYAAYVELGTSKMTAQPYLRPALAAELGGTP